MFYIKRGNKLGLSLPPINDEAPAKKQKGSKKSTQIIFSFDKTVMWICFNVEDKDEANV
jgi:hypothetical protein